MPSSEVLTLEVSDTAAEVLGLMDGQQWPSISLLAELKGPRSSHRFRFQFPRVALFAAVDHAERMIPAIRQENAHKYAAAVSRALRVFIRDAQAALAADAIP